MNLALGLKYLKSTVNNVAKVNAKQSVTGGLDLKQDGKKVQPQTNIKPVKIDI
jgi:hypothetical protein